MGFVSNQLLPFSRIISLHKQREREKTRRKSQFRTVHWIRNNKQIINRDKNWTIVFFIQQNHFIIETKQRPNFMGRIEQGKLLYNETNKNGLVNDEKQNHYPMVIINHFSYTVPLTKSSHRRTKAHLIHVNEPNAHNSPFHHIRSHFLVHKSNGRFCHRKISSKFLMPLSFRCVVSLNPVSMWFYFFFIFAVSTWL